MADVKIKITGDSSQFVQEVDKVEGKTSTLSNTLKELGKVSAIAFAALTGVVIKSLDAYREQELATNQLNQALVNQGIYTKELSKSYQEQAAALQKVTTYGDEAIIQAQATLQAQLGTLPVTKELTKATLDFAAAQGMDLKSAADLVGKSIGSSTNALTRYGIEIDASGDKQSKLTAVIDGLNSKFAGQAEAQASGLGSLIQLKNAFGDFLELIGQSFAPLVIEITKRLTDFTTKAQESGTAMETLKTIVGSVGKAVSFVKLVFEELGTAIGITIGVAVESITNLMEGEFQKALDATKIGYEQFKEETKANYAAFQDEISIIDETLRTQRQENELESIAMQEQAKINLVRNIQAQKQKEDEEAKKKADEAEKKRLEKELKDREEYLKKYNAVEQFWQNQKVGMTVDTLNNLSKLTQSKNKEVFEIGKLAAKASAIVNIAEGVTKALGQGGGILGPILAASVIAAGAVQLATINAQSLAEGGLVAGGAPYIDRMPAMLTPGELVVPRQNFDEVVGSVGKSRAGSGIESTGRIEIVLRDDLVNFIEAKIVENKNLNLSVQGA